MAPPVKSGTTVAVRVGGRATLKNCRKFTNVSLFLVREWNPYVGFYLISDMAALYLAARSPG